MKTALFILLILQASYSVHASTFRCFEEHVVTAKKLNLDRSKLYKEITNGESVKISRNFILIQDVLMPISKVLDRMAKNRVTEDQPKFFCQEFVSMNDTPDFQSFVSATTPIPEELKDKSYTSKELRKRLKDSFKNQNYQGLLAQSEKELKKLEETPSYYCLTRHFLESIARASYYAQSYNSEQRFISNLYIKMQIFGMRAAGILDEKAAPLQEKGIAILCQDIPKIPLHE